MKMKLLLLRLVVLVAAVMCALGASAAEAYACYTPSNTTLTFYYDNQRASREGTTYDLNIGSNEPEWCTNSIHAYVTQVVFDPSFAEARPTTTCYWFSSMERLQNITGMEYLNTSEVTNMAYMFSSCRKLTTLDLSHFNTSNVTSMEAMFSSCHDLTNLDLTSFNTDNVTTMYCMFNYSDGLTSVDLSSFTNARVENMDNMFECCSALTTIYASSGWSTAAVTTSWAMFIDCNSLVGGKGTAYDANHIDAAYAHIDGGPSNPGYFTDINVPSEAYACYTPSNTTLTFYYDNLRSIRPGTTYNLNDSSSDPGWRTDGTNANVTKVVFNSSFANARPTSTYFWFYEMERLTSITSINYLNTSEVTTMRGMFTYCKELTSLDLRSFNTSNVTDMMSMFWDCFNLTNLDLSSFNTANVTGMNFMFSGCKALESLDLSSFNTSNVTDMRYMFGSCNSLTNLDLSNFNTANVTNMRYMFYDCSALTTLDLSSFNTANVTDMEDMFNSCSAMTSFDLSSFNTANVTNMRYMFRNCSALTSLDLSSFNTANVTSMSFMFEGARAMSTISVSNEWSTAAVTYSLYMFNNCTSLVGGKGTTYDANHIDATYAHIDGGPSNPGYFTEKAGGQCGDVNGDNNVNISDVTALIDILLNEKPAPQAADCNQDGSINISDVTALIDYLLSGI